MTVVVDATVMVAALVDSGPQGRWAEAVVGENALAAPETVEVARPERIILYGSAVRGEMDPHSDVDLLVVEEGVRRRDTAALILDEMSGVGAAVDVVVVTPEDIERYGDSHALVIKPALQQGRVVYEAT